METSKPISNDDKPTSRKEAVKVIKSLVELGSGIVATVGGIAATLQFFGGLTIATLFLVCGGVSILVIVGAGGLIWARKTGVAERLAWTKKLTDQVSDRFLWTLVVIFSMTLALSFINVRKNVTRVDGGIPKPVVEPTRQAGPNPVGIEGEKRGPTPGKARDDSAESSSDGGPAKTLMDVLSVRAKSPRSDESGLTGKLISALSPRLKIPGYENLKKNSIVVEVWFDENADGRIGDQIWGTWSVIIDGSDTCRYEKQGKYGSGRYALLNAAKEEAVNDGLDVITSFLRENISVTGLRCVK